MCICSPCWQHPLPPWLPHLQDAARLLALAVLVRQLLQDKGKDTGRVRSSEGMRGLSRTACSRCIHAASGAWASEQLPHDAQPARLAVVADGQQARLAFDQVAAHLLPLGSRLRSWRVGGERLHDAGR